MFAEGTSKFQNLIHDLAQVFQQSLKKESIFAT